MRFFNFYIMYLEILLSSVFEPARVFVHGRTLPGEDTHVYAPVKYQSCCMLLYEGVEQK